MIQDNINEQKQGKMNSLKRFLINLFDIRGDMMSYEDIDAMMEENTDIHGSNMWILMMAIMIASIGLNVNSTAVIIGAMLISPLMSGILTMGYSLAVRDLKLMRRALLSFGVQMVISLITFDLFPHLSAWRAYGRDDCAYKPHDLGCTDCFVRWYSRDYRKYKAEEKQCNSGSSDCDCTDATALYRWLRNCHNAGEISPRGILSVLY